MESYDPLLELLNKLMKQQGALEDVPELGMPGATQQQQQEGGEAFLIISLPEQVRVF